MNFIKIAKNFANWQGMAMKYLINCFLNVHKISMFFLSREGESFDDDDMLDEADREEQLKLTAALLGTKFIGGKLALATKAASAASAAAIAKAKGIAGFADSFLDTIDLADLSSRNHICLAKCRNSPHFEKCLNHCRDLVGLSRVDFDLGVSGPISTATASIVDDPRYALLIFYFLF